MLGDVAKSPGSGLLDGGLEGGADLALEFRLRVLDEGGEVCDCATIHNSMCKLCNAEGKQRVAQEKQADTWERSEYREGETSKNKLKREAGQTEVKALVKRIML